MTTDELPTQYEPQGFEAEVFQRWLDAEAFKAVPDDRDGRYVVMMPLPNVTGALHMGHAMDNVMQDLLVRWHRMQGDNSLWMAGTDHAGIATQAVVEKRLKELDGKTRHDVGREGLVERIWAWKDQYQARIVRQQQAMGCSCDWERQRFTMDEVCSVAVRETFFRMFRDKLIFRGKRLVNWDCHLQTAVADDEVYHQAVQGHFWHLRYPVIDPQPGEPDHVVVATTRPETMLGDTAVACHPDPAKVLTRLIAEAEAKLQDASAKERPAAEAELKRLQARQAEVLPRLEALARMARDGRQLRLPLQDRPIPLIVDDWAKPELGSGCVKITPAHDPNDYQVWQRHKDTIDAINLLQPDGTLNEHAGAYQGLDRFAARKRVVADLDAQGLLERVEDREVEIGHSDRSKTPIEPYLSKQWFVWMDDVDGGVLLGHGTPHEHRAPGLAQAAIDVANGQASPTGREVAFHPDADRYRRGYTDWLAEKRDWCISRQLWWGHRIPVWHKAYDALADMATDVSNLPQGEDLHAWISDADGHSWGYEEALAADGLEGPFELLVCVRRADADEELGGALEALGLERDPDVLDTWFSSGLWPHSTLGWPDPERAPVLDGQRPLDGCLDYYYPGSCLVTGRDILTLWVARMVVMGLYNLGDVPFTDVFLHAKILDGKGVTMSKSKGNGVDPVDIIERYGADAMRYVICDMQTGTQDIRLPVQAKCPHCEHEVELADAKHGKNDDGTVRIFTYLCTKCKGEFDVLGTMDDVAPSAPYSTRFEVGSAFCNKLWNAIRFALLNLGDDAPRRDLDPAALPLEDRWVLSRLTRAVQGVQSHLQAYNPSAAINLAREFFWTELCDWYLEAIKPRLRQDGESADTARQVLAFVLDQVLRLLHPFVPFVTEVLWARLTAQAPARGIDGDLPTHTLLALAAWPEARPEWIDAALDAEFATMQETITGIRKLRKEYDVPPSRTLTGAIEAPAARVAQLERQLPHISHLANLENVAVATSVTPPERAGTTVIGEAKVYLADVLDPEKERKRLTKDRQKLVGAAEGKRKKLANEKFVAKAPPAVVEGERTKLAELEQQIAQIDATLALIQP